MWILNSITKLFFILIFLSFCECNNQTNNNNIIQHNLINNNNNITNNNNTFEDIKNKKVNDKNKEEIVWVCGTNEITQAMSKNLIEADCPDKKYSINNCCIIHDNCYDEQKGFDYCNNNFCECLMEASFESKCTEDTQLFCDLVKDFGETYYNSSANNKPITTHPILPKKEEKNSIPIKRIY
ncbi:hypothetical protein Mgra_00000465 [Meloidogyne graminicola]|uniref:Phospholipase A2 n=1 Tax=Meloidogyne graminicola TaxID=189291 RepID=A0A8T0A379_9BILA|nr:hypothetical protein Mgra_00000465 [Meloidogyne graminicola]